MRYNHLAWLHTIWSTCTREACARARARECARACEQKSPVELTFESQVIITHCSWYYFNSISVSPARWLPQVGALTHGAPIFIFKRIVSAHTYDHLRARKCPRYITRAYKREWWIDLAVGGMRLCAFDDYWSIFPKRHGTEPFGERFGDPRGLSVMKRCVYLHTRSAAAAPVYGAFPVHFPEDT